MHYGKNKSVYELFYSVFFLTSAPINAHMLMPLKQPKIIETIIIIPDMVKIEESSAIKRKCDHPRVVGEKES